MMAGPYYQLPDAKCTICNSTRKWIYSKEKDKYYMRYYSALPRSAKRCRHEWKNDENI